MAPPSKLTTFLDEFRALDPELKMDLLIETAERFTGVPENIAHRPYPKSHLVPGCESEAYAWASAEVDKVKVHFAVENPHGISAKALAVILTESLSGSTATEIQEVPEDLVYDLFGRSLSMGKGQGLIGMIRMVKQLAYGA